MNKREKKKWIKALDSLDEQWMGSGSFLPIELHSGGELDLVMGPWQFSLYEA